MYIQYTHTYTYISIAIHAVENDFSLTEILKLHCCKAQNTRYKAQKHVAKLNNMLQSSNKAKKQTHNHKHTHYSQLQVSKHNFMTQGRVLVQILTRFLMELVQN